MLPEEIGAVSRQVAASYRAAYRGLMEEGYLSTLTGDGWVPTLRAALSAGNTVLVAVDGPEIVGSIVFGRSTADPQPEVAEVFALYLLPAYVGMGIGHRLYDMAEGHMLEQGAAACVAEALCDNLRSIQFCLEHGFRDGGDFSVEENGMLLRCKTLRKDWNRSNTINEEGIETR